MAPEAALGGPESAATPGEAPMRRTRINERWELLLPEHRAARPEWPEWERERLAAMAERIGPGDVVFDVGAEEGDFPALWASWGAEVVMVEPNPRVWPNIRAIFRANELEDRVRGWFVGFVGEKVDLYRPDWMTEHVGALWRVGDEPHGCVPGRPWPQCAYGPVIGDHGFLVLPERPDCPVTTVDELAARYGAPTVITLDVEGAEATVLRGAARTLREERPTVFVSVHIDLPWIDEKYPGDTREVVLSLMGQAGYVGEHLATDHEEHWAFRPR